MNLLSDSRRPRHGDAAGDRNLVWCPPFYESGKEVVESQGSGRTERIPLERISETVAALVFFSFHGPLGTSAHFYANYIILDRPQLLLLLHRSLSSPTSNVVRSPGAISIRKYIYTRDQSPFSIHHTRSTYLVWPRLAWMDGSQEQQQYAVLLCTHCSTSARYKILIPVPALVSFIHFQRPFINSNPSAASLLRTHSMDTCDEDEIIVEAGFR